MKTQPTIPHPVLIALSAIAFVIAGASIWMIGGGQATVETPLLARKSGTVAGNLDVRNETSPESRGDAAPASEPAPAAESRTDANPDAPSATMNESVAEHMRSGARRTAGANILGARTKSSTEGPFEPAEILVNSGLPAVFKPAPVVLAPQEVAAMDEHAEQSATQFHADGSPAPATGDTLDTYRKLRDLLGSGRHRQEQFERDRLATRFGSDAVQSFELLPGTTSAP